MKIDSSMYKLISAFLLVIIFTSCQEHSKSAEKPKKENVVTASKDMLSKSKNVIIKDSVKDSQTISLPFDLRNILRYVCNRALQIARRYIRN